MISDVMGIMNHWEPRLELFPITGAMCHRHPMELMLTSNPGLKNSDSFIEKLYIERAYWNHKLVSPNKFHVLGDRSIATACVTRWEKWNDPYYTIRKVNGEYSGIIKPDVFIWLKTTQEMAVANIAKRPVKCLGNIDEAPAVLEKTRNIYEELFRGRIFNRKIRKVQLVEVDNHTDIKETEKELISILNFYTSL